MFFAGVTKFDPATGKQFKASGAAQSYTTYFAEALIAEAEADKDIIAIHAAMGGGTGLNLFHKRFPERCFDVGIAEQHAVTFAAGLACEGLKPFCAIYSSFMQRAYDQASLEFFLTSKLKKRLLFSLSLVFSRDLLSYFPGGARCGLAKVGGEICNGPSRAGGGRWAHTLWGL